MTTRDRCLRGFVTVVVLGLIWLVALPRLARQPLIRDRVERFERKGIDPAALFYTDHDSRWDLGAE